MGRGVERGLTKALPNHSLSFSSCSPLSFPQPRRSFFSSSYLHFQATLFVLPVSLFPIFGVYQQARRLTSSLSLPLSPYLCLSDEGRDLLGWLAVWVWLKNPSQAVGLPIPPSTHHLPPFSPSLPVCLFGSATPPHQCPDYKNPVCSF